MNLRFWASIIAIYLVGCQLAYSQQGLRPRGDVNCDWTVNITDVNVLVDSVIKRAHYHPFYSYADDVNGDRDINISDINLVISAIFGQNLPPMPSYSGTLPVLFINSGGEYQDITSREEYIQADWWLDNMGHDEYQSFGSAQEPLGMLIKGRGNFSWTALDKKSFRVKLDEKLPLMGMHSNRHYCLLAHADDFLAYLKNTMGFELSRRIGLAYTPAQEPVEVVLNGQYIGLYFLTEKIRVGKHRVDIEEQMDGETAPDKITGGWLLEITNVHEDNTLYFHEQPENDFWLGVTPESPELLSKPQMDYIWNYIQRTNDAIYTDDKTSTEWEKYIDIDTLAMYYIVGEIMDDLEYFSGSCYMYKHRGDSTKLIFGPVWDFGNAFQRWAIYHDTQFNKFIVEEPTPFASHWIEEILKYPHFQQVLREHWQSFYQQGFNGLEMDQYMDVFVNKIRSAFDCELQRWPKYYNNIDHQKTEFSTFIHRKIDWLDTQWGKPQT